MKKGKSTRDRVQKRKARFILFVAVSVPRKVESVHEADKVNVIGKIEPE